MKYFQFPLVALLSSLLVILPITGCTASQAKINTVIQDIATWAPIISNDATALSVSVEQFDPKDAALIQQSVVTMQTDSAFLTKVCNQYLANPSSSTMAQITATISDLATTDSNALLATLQIKNSNSLTTAKAVLSAIATVITILDGYLATVKINVTPTAQKSIKQMKPFVQKSIMVTELNKAKTQGLVPENITLSQLGY